METDEENLKLAIEFARDSVEDNTYGDYEFEYMDQTVQFAALIGFFSRIDYELTQAEMDILAKEVISPDCGVYRKFQLE